MVDIPVLIIGLVVIVLIWYVGDFLGKLGNPEGRKELSGELKKEKFWNTQTLKNISINYLWYLNGIRIT